MNGKMRRGDRRGGKGGQKGRQGGTGGEARGTEGEVRGDRSGGKGGQKRGGVGGKTGGGEGGQGQAQSKSERLFRHTFLLSTRALLPSGQLQGTPQEEMEVQEIRYLVNGHQREGSATATSTSHTTCRRVCDCLVPSPMSTYQLCVQTAWVLEGSCN